VGSYETPIMPYVESKYQGGKQRPTIIIITPSYTTSKKGAALGIAQTWHSSSSRYDSGHYAVDNDTTFRCVSDLVIAGHKSAMDKGAIRITICADPLNRSIFWDTDKHGRVLRNAAKLVADLSLAYKIRVRYLSEEEKMHWAKRRSRRRGGIFIGEGMGNWPSEVFLREVEAQRALKTHI